MSKTNKAIAALSIAASLGMAAAPMATFADGISDTHTDTLNITVAPACSFGSAADPDHVVTGVEHAAGSPQASSDAGSPAVGAWETTDSNGTGRIPDSPTGTNNNESNDTFTYSIFAGTKKDAMATTTLTVFCNDNSGYMIKAVTNSLSDTAQSNQGTPIAAQQYSTSTSGYGITGVTSTPMTVAKGADGTSAVAADNVFVASNATTIAYKESPSDAAGDSVTMTYGIGIAPAQKAATYEGTVVYTLIHPYSAS